MIMNYKNSNEIALDAFDIINQMMGELQAARMIYFLVSDEFLEKPRMKGFKELLTETTLVYIRRTALSTLTSVMFLFKELYDNFLGVLDCRVDVAKTLLKSTSRDNLEKLRHVSEHLLDKKTGRYHSLEKINGLFSSLNENSPDLMTKEISNIIKDLENIRNLIKEKYPDTNNAIKKRYEELIMKFTDNEIRDRE